MLLSVICLYCNNISFFLRFCCIERKMPKCCVRFCFNSSTKNQENGFVFFLWPKNENVIDKWLQEFAVHCNVTGYSQQHFKITRSMRICNLHFEENCFTKETNKLLKDAVPTIFKFTAKVNYFLLYPTNSLNNTMFNSIFHF
jgi:hypothetical protein